MSLNRRIRRVYIDQEDKLKRSTPMSNVLKVFTFAMLVALAPANAMAEQGAKVNVLLCDEAGDLALKSYEAEALAPKNVTPGQMLRGLLKAGGTANVCALYLPNSEYGKDDLIDGVGVAMPPQMAGQMLDRKIRTFSF